MFGSKKSAKDFQAKKPSSTYNAKNTDKTIKSSGTISKGAATQNKSNPASTASKSDPSPERKKKYWIRLGLVAAVFLLALATVFYLDVFGLRAMLFSREKVDPITHISSPADMIDSKLASATRVDLLSQAPTTSGGNGTIDLFLKDGQLFIAENGASKPLIASNQVNDYKLAFSFSQAAPNQLVYLIGNQKTTQYDMIREHDIPVINGNPGTSYPAVRIYTTANAKAGILSIENLSFNVQRSAPFVLPATLEAKLADGTVSTVPVIWSPVRIDTTENGVRGSIGKVEGYPRDVMLTLVISDVPDGRLPDITLEVEPNAVVTMPEMLNIILSDGKTKTAPVTWSPEKIDTSTTGLKTAQGTVSGYLQKSILSVTVKGIVAVTPPSVTTTTPPPATTTKPPATTTTTPPPTTTTKPPTTTTKPPVVAPKPVAVTITSLRSVTATVKQGTGYTMPGTVVAVLSDGKTKTVAVTWNPSSLDTQTAGTMTSVGSVSGTTKKASLTLTVTKSSLSAPKVAVSKMTGTDATVQVTGKVGASVLFNGSSVGTIGSGGVLTVSGVNIDTLQSVKLTLAGWDPSPTVTTFVLY